MSFATVAPKGYESLAFLISFVVAIIYTFVLTQGLNYLWNYQIDMSEKSGSLIKICFSKNKKNWSDENVLKFYT